MDAARIAERVARGVHAGEDWEVTDATMKVAVELIRLISRKGGYARSTRNHVEAREFPVDGGSSVPLEIDLYEGSYHPGKLLINATFRSGGRVFPIPVRDRIGMDAREVFEAIEAGFLSLVNHKG